MPNKITFEECQKRLNNEFPDEDIKLIEYTKMSGLSTYKCLKCNCESHIKRTSDLFRKKHLCNNCWYSAGKGEKTQVYKEEALKIINNSKDLNFIEFGYNKKLMKPTIKFKCLNCNSISEFQLIYFIKYPHCSHCSYNAKHLNTEGIKTRLPEDYTLLEEYTSTDEKILVRHEKCGFIWKATIHGLLSDYRCPKCSKKRSKGEQDIEKWLQENNFIYSIEKIFDWSENHRYDFYIPSMSLVIEYMGIQHFKEVPFFKRPLEEQQKIDIWKKEKALLNGLNYLSISYEDFNNIDNILAQRLSRKESREEILETESILLKDEDIV